MTIEEKETEFIEKYQELEDWFLQYSWILSLSKEADSFGKVERLEENKIRGCQSIVWARIEYIENKLLFCVDSDAMIVKGLFGVIAILVNGKTREEICSWKPKFIQETSLGKHLSNDRQKGVQSVINSIKSC